MLDPGRYTYAEPERRWFRGTAAHNTVTVDGLDQTPYARGRSSAPAAQATYLAAGFVLAARSAARSTTPSTAAG